MEALFLVWYSGYDVFDTFSMTNLPGSQTHLGTKRGLLRKKVQVQLPLSAGSGLINDNDLDTIMIQVEAVYTLFAPF